ILAALLLLAALVWACLFRPLSIELDAPDQGDLFALSIAHPLFWLRLRLPTRTVIAWAIGERPLPPLSGEVAGIPVRPIAEWALARPARPAKEKPVSRPAAEKPPLLDRLRAM